MRRREPSVYIDPPPGAFVAIDFETADNYPDSACSVGLVRVENGRVSRRVRQLIRPPRDQVWFTHIHGLTLEDVREKPTFGRAWPALREVFEGAVFLAAHNAGFDKRVLEACCESAGIDPPALPWVCTVRQARRTLGIRPANLDNVARVMGIKLNHHEALSDAEACARIVMAARRVLAESASSRS
jgi:DNA polymerase-3 subunit epsilon